MVSKMHPPDLPMSIAAEKTAPRPRSHRLLYALCALIVTVALLAADAYIQTASSADASRVHHVPFNAAQILSQCAALRQTPGPPEGFLERDSSDRFEPGTKPTLIKNAAIWTGARNGAEIVYGDIYIDKGVVKRIGYIPDSVYAKADDVQVVDAQGSWVTPGLVDLHSHVGLFSIPFMRGAYDVNSAHGPVVPWLRSIDAFDTHDEAFKLAIAGGVTSVQVLPGSGNAIGGQAFMFKLRKTLDKSPSSMILEPPHNLGINNSEPESSEPLRWRHMKQACGENLIRYGNRMDTAWSFRSAYNEARKIKVTQDMFCAKAEAGLWDEIKGQEYPENLQWEMLVDVLRGRVKISNHCYEEVDLDDIVRLTNEFQFPIASFHHASEAWLVPDVLKRTWGGTPAVSVFATSARYKREAYRSSPFAARVLADNGIPVVMKSDHPILNSRYLLYEAQQAHYYGLSPNVALASVTVTPATAAGMEHRIGILHEGADADVVLWDSHPLQLGATPRKVWIDGILQVGFEEENIIIGKDKDTPEFRELPQVPNWDKEREEAIKWEGLPPLMPVREKGRVAFRNVREIWKRDEDHGIKPLTNEEELVDVVVDRGQVTCVGKHCLGGINAKYVIDLQGGSISPSFMSFGSTLGVEEISAEPSTGDGALYNPLLSDLPEILGDRGGLVRAADALQFGTRNALIAHRAGVTYATTLPGSTGFSSIIAGLSVTYRTGASHALERGAIVKEVTALHVVIERSAPFSSGGAVSVSTQIATLRRLLQNGEPEGTETGYWFRQAAKGSIPLVVEVSSADIMATLLKLKEDIHQDRGSVIKMVFFRATEAHLIANEIAKAKVGVILEPARPFPQTWDERRILAGPPLTNDTALITLTRAGVIVGVGVREPWEPANTRFDIAWAALETNGRMTPRQAHALASTNLEAILGVDGWLDGELVAYTGGSALEFTSKPVAVISAGRRLVDVL
ncbi:composite domain of metallo-dependent hydrolase [Laetiporus sulphureus 93-53]|uniref:Composite domain of metallo-dependent hydrolase n=1 Tax=Laetiporus sulphureus 93-53 TaxID=1314785 RepID=A0A165E872_9APHY|nr:composite domain of metallo-dependent hydrolase [Laetiporus sulphureus 93-53]KZT06435.1 composite domain of metallo-dependent hydrolase [Laetiporus sulphureus 93-53]